MKNDKPDWFTGNFSNGKEIIDTVLVTMHIVDYSFFRKMSDLFMN